jgi:hypothetical protein
MSAFIPPVGNNAAGSSNTPADADVSASDLTAMQGAQGNPETDTSGDGMTMGQLQPAYTPAGQQAPIGMHNYTPTGSGGSYAHHPPGTAAPSHLPSISTRHGVSHAGLSRVINHLRGMSSGSGARLPHASAHISSSVSKGPHPSAGFKSSGLKSNGGLKSSGGLGKK